MLLSPLPILLKLSFSRIPLSGLLVTGPLLSLTIELVQRYVPGRVSDLIDFAHNSLGFLVVAMIGILRSQKSFCNRGPRRASRTTSKLTYFRQLPYGHEEP